MSPDIFLNFLLALLVGGLIGIERNMPSTVSTTEPPPEESDLGWARTYALLAFLGALMTWVDSLLGGYFWMILGFLAIFFFILTGYVYSAFRTHRLGLSTELAGIITYMLGAIVMLEHYTIAAILSILVLILLSGKETIASWSQHISRQEFSHTLKFGVISLVVLPLLPRESYSINQILGLMGNTFEVSHPILSMPFINPFSIWFFVVIMAGIEYVGYILSKVLWNRWGTVLSGAVGGLISSTAVTGAMTTKSHENTHHTYAYVAAVLIASMIMCIRVIVVSAFYSPHILQTLLLPALAMLSGLGVMAWIYYRRDKKTSSAQVKVDGWYSSPFRLLPAMQFALIIVGVKFLAGIGLIYQDSINLSIFYTVLGIISGLADVDAITMDMAGKSAEGVLSLMVASSTILIATMSNNVVKAGIAYRFGEKTYGKSVLLGFGLSILLGLVAIAVMSFATAA